MGKNSRNIFLAGDSTVQAYKEKDSKQGGWGEFLTQFLPEEIKVLNHAIGGRSAKSFVEEGRLQRLLEEMKGNDYLLIQMGHNDATKSKPERYTEPYSTYKAYLTKYIEGAQRVNATPILITPVARLHVENGKFINDFPDYCQAMKQLAEAKKIKIVDLMEKSLSYFQSIGYEQSLQLFMASINKTDFTHFTKKGAKEMAKLVVEGLYEIELELLKVVK
ncbi:rhamnogalacturonan acetylesterase [Bacillus sp. SA1-12]|uniref:rhamnogalacturonan acetylesterase n=1 Tax=Bacillus sp. SA1-12 TaxID=1455638 RepID=UPI0006272291|nr:rhamnogalacturonan acetylesterase [Bacillus sp. SA1-12]KKI90218.1 rhamnogalacturonan acetylesterase [Bacillus sp. SA1-12]